MTDEELKKADYKAYYFGTEFQANLGSSRKDYMEDCALAYGHASWSDVPKELRVRIERKFAEGREAERKGGLRA